MRRHGEKLMSITPLSGTKFSNAIQLLLSITIKNMVKVLAAEKVLYKKTGRPSKLSTKDQILMRLAYWREYSTYFHLGTS